MLARSLELAFQPFAVLRRCFRTARSSVSGCRKVPDDGKGDATVDDAGASPAEALAVMALARPAASSGTWLLEHESRIAYGRDDHSMSMLSRGGNVQVALSP